MRFNILYLHETARFSGAEESLFNLVRFQNRKLYNSFFVLPEEGHFSRKLQDIGFEVFIVPMPRIRGIRGVAFSAKNILSIASKNIQLLHTNSIRTHIYGAYAAKKLKIPIIWHQRNLLTSEWIDPDRLFSFLPDKIICNSQAIANRFSVETQDSKIKVIYNGVDTDMFNPSISAQETRDSFFIKSNDVVIGIASRFHPIKGHETFFRAAKLLIQDMPEMRNNLRFLVVGGVVFKGDKRREEYLKNMVGDLGLSEQVTFTGFREDMPAVYAAIDIFVLASQMEACGRVIVEAMSSGKPVLATDSGGTPEIIEDGKTGFLVKPRKPKEMAKRLTWLINNPAPAKKMAEEARKRIEQHFRIEKNVAETEAMYAELLDSRTA